MQQRYYDPLVARFSSVDFTYAAGNPLLFKDPDGRLPCHITNKLDCLREIEAKELRTGIMQWSEGANASGGGGVEKTRYESLREAKRFAGIPGNVQPKVEYDDLYDGDKTGSDRRDVKTRNGEPVKVRVYVFSFDGKTVKIHEHSAGHFHKDKDGSWKFTEKGHFNITDGKDNKLPGAKAHYEFNSKIDPVRYFWRRGGVPVARGSE